MSSKAYFQSYYQRNKERIAGRQKVYYRKNRDRIRARVARNAGTPEAIRRERRRCLDPERRRKQREAACLRAYGITLAQKQAMRLAQRNRCACCGDKFVPQPRRKKSCNVDHCHRTGRVRELLCSDCNKGIGYFGDNPDRLIAAAAYLRKHQLSLAS